MTVTERRAATGDRHGRGRSRSRRSHAERAPASGTLERRPACRSSSRRTSAARVAAPARACCGPSGSRVVVVARARRRQRHAASCSGPRVLGHATDIIVDGVIEPGRASTSASCTARCCSALGLYVGVGRAVVRCSRYMLAGVVQRTMFRLRADVEDKLNRLPLSYVDRQPRGDLLSRVTNDIDNLAQSLQQTLSQMLTSVAHARRRR